MSEKKEKTKSLATVEKNITDQILVKVKTLTEAKMLRLPKDYSVENALKGAYIILQDVKDKNGKLAIEVCTKDSVALSLLRMCTEGLSPLKKQGSFIIRGNRLNWEREYDGDVALAKRAGLEWIRARCIYENDEYQTKIDENGVKSLVKHEQPIENIDENKIKGAYVIYEVNGKKELLEMTINQIRTSWQQGAMKGQSPAHKNFTSAMCERTVTRKACKPLIRRVDDSGLFSDDENPNDINYETAQEEIQENANKEEINFDDVEEIKDEQSEMAENKAETPETPLESIKPDDKTPDKKEDNKNPQQGNMFPEQNTANGPGF